jgi:hypothetical protein
MYQSMIECLYDHLIRGKKMITKKMIDTINNILKNHNFNERMEQIESLVDTVYIDLDEKDIKLLLVKLLVDNETVLKELSEVK